VPTKPEVDRQRKALAELTRKVGTAFDDLWLRVQGLPVDQIRDAFVEMAQALADEYGSAAGSLAADFLEDAWAEAKMPGRCQVALAKTDPARVEGSVRAAARDLSDGRGEAFLQQVKAATGRHVENRHRETVRLTADRNNGGWARVPAPGSDCKFCLMLASRGFVYGSRKKAESSGRGRYHDNCHCAAVASWQKNPRLEGYDPDALYKRWQGIEAADQNRSLQRLDPRVERHDVDAAAPPRTRGKAPDVERLEPLIDFDSGLGGFAPDDRQFAEMLNSLGLPPVAHVRRGLVYGMKTPDAVFVDGLTPIEFKGISKDKATTVMGQIRKGARQSSRIAVDGSAVGLTRANAEAGIRMALAAGEGAWIDEVLVVLSPSEVVTWRRV
jgi:hypothetical protein